MEEIKLFYTPLWRHDLAREEPQWAALRRIMLDRIRTLAANDAGADKSNFGGWQSNDDLYRYAEFGWLIGRLMALANELAPQFSTTRKFDDGLLWANINRPGDFNAVHTHPDAILSGVLYLQVESSAQGELQFIDAREGMPTTHWRCFMRLEESTPLTSEVHTVAPREGLLLFFPGWLKHWVTPNRGTGERISVSFNVRMQ